MTQNQNARINDLLTQLAKEFGTDESSVNAKDIADLSAHVQEVLTGTSERKQTTLYFVGANESQAKTTNEFDSYESAEDYMLSQSNLDDEFNEVSSNGLNVYIASADIDFKTLQKYNPYGV